MHFRGYFSFLKKAFTHFSTQDTINWFESRGVPLHAEADGRMFPKSNHSQTIIDCLLDEAAKYRVKIQLNTEIISIQKKGTQFILEDKKGNVYTADYLMIASGGFPKPEQYQWLQALGHSIQQPAPSLFTFNMQQHPICQLMGVSVEQVSVKIVGSKLSTSGPNV